MNAQAILDEAAALGIVLVAVNGRIVARPKGMTPPALAARVREHKAALLAALARSPSTADSMLARLRSPLAEVEQIADEAPPVSRARVAQILADERGRCAGRKPPGAALVRSEPRTATPDSRHPLIAPEVRAKIEAIEAEARAKGWPAELIWNAGYWDCPRGLAAVLDPDDEIAEVRADSIAILKARRDLLRFRRHSA